MLFILVGYAINIVLGRLLGPINYGIYGVLVSLISVANILQTSGLTQSMAKYIAANEKIAELEWQLSQYNEKYLRQQRLHNNSNEKAKQTEVDSLYLQYDVYQHFTNIYDKYIDFYAVSLV